VQVKNGIYREIVRLQRSGTRELPITFMAYPNHKPAIANGGVQIQANWVIIDGFEIREADNGIHLVTPYKNVTLRNNTFERNGVGKCVSSMWGGQNYSHCHGIYLSNPGFACSSQMSNVTIRRNRFLSNSGSGIQIYSNCSDSQKHFNHLVENNLFVNNATGMYIWSIRDSKIRNNTIIQTDWPRPQINSVSGLNVNGARGNVIANNVVYTTELHSETIRTWHPMTNTWTNNAVFALAGGTWMWELKPLPFSRTDYQHHRQLSLGGPVAAAQRGP
jgi:parallel beta-helix repeat protein